MSLEKRGELFLKTERKLPKTLQAVVETCKLVRIVQTPYFPDS